MLPNVIDTLELIVGHARLSFHQMVFQEETYNIQQSGQLCEIMLKISNRERSQSWTLINVTVFIKWKIHIITLCWLTTLNFTIFTLNY